MGLFPNGLLLHSLYMGGDPNYLRSSWEPILQVPTIKKPNQPLVRMAREDGWSVFVDRWMELKNLRC